jgi:hypothetical protein
MTESPAIITAVTLICATIIVCYAMNLGLVDSEHLLYYLILLFGGEQVARMWVKAQIKAGHNVPSLILSWFKATEVGPWI